MIWKLLSYAYVGIVIIPLLICVCLGHVCEFLTAKMTQGLNYLVYKGQSNG